MSKRQSAAHPALLMGMALGFAVIAAPAFASEPPKAEHAHAMGESNEPVSDSWITTKVKADLLGTKNVPSTEIKVDTVNGVVTLSGEVGGEAERERAITVAKGIKGVVEVVATDLKVVLGKR